MKLAIIVKLTGILYNAGLREFLIEFIDNPDSLIDDKVVAALDIFFGYKDEKVND